MFNRLFSSFQGSRVQIRACQDPLLGGIGEALKVSRLSEIVERYRGMADIFILCVDRDGDVGHRVRLDEIESTFQDGAACLAANAWEELEAWVLAGLDLPVRWNWADARAEINVKETYFEELVRRRGLVDDPGGGRRGLGDEAARRIPAIRAKCREDFDHLAVRLETIRQGP